MSDRDSAISTPAPGDVRVAKATAASPQMGRDSDPDVTVTRRIDGVASALARLGNTEGATITGIVAHPSMSTGDIADRYDLEHRSVQRAVSKARKAGLVMGDSGAWVPVLPHQDSPPTGESVAVRLAERAAGAEAATITFRNVKYGSRLERDVAVALDALGVTPRLQVPYTEFIQGCERAWTADFLLMVTPKVVIEVTSDRPGAADTIGEKRVACVQAGVAFVAVTDISGLLERVREARARITSKPPVTAISQSNAESYMLGACHVVRAGINRTVVAEGPPRVPRTPVEDAAVVAFHAAEERAGEAARRLATEAIADARSAYRVINPDFVEALELAEAHEAAEREVIAQVSTRIMSAYNDAAAARLRAFIFGSSRTLFASTPPSVAEGHRAPEVPEPDDNYSPDDGDHDAEDVLSDEDLLFLTRNG